MSKPQDPANFGNIAILAFLVICLYWNIVVTILSLLFLIFLKYQKVNPLHSLLIGICLFLLVIIIDIALLHRHRNIYDFFYNSVQTNKIFIHLLTKYGTKLSFLYLYEYCWEFCLSLPLPLAALMLILHNLFIPAHGKELNKIGKAKLDQANIYNHKVLEGKLRKLTDYKFDGSLLGISLRTNKPVVLPDKYINQIVLVLGTTGAGKTITLRRFYQRALYKGFPLIIVDGKPTEENVQYIERLAKKFDRQFYGFNCNQNSYYDAFSNGNFTEVKDKIITLKDHWESDYYRTLAEDYIQTVIEVLQKDDKSISIRDIAHCLDYDRLVERVRLTKDEVLAGKVSTLKHYQRESLTGFQAHLNMLLNSELGMYLCSNQNAFTLKGAINYGAVVYFALPALKFPSFASMLGKLVINDIKTTIEPLCGNVPIFIIFDEFSIFAGEQVLNLINMGRGKGLHTVLGTQGLGDLQKISPQFESQLLNCVNTLICHRLNNQSCAESVSKWIGTQDSFDLTAQINANSNLTTMGSATKNKAFLVHPDEIKQYLSTGEAVYATKVESFALDTVKIKHDTS
jgi:hypothetical protein